VPEPLRGEATTESWPTTSRRWQASASKASAAPSSGRSSLVRCRRAASVTIQTESIYNWKANQWNAPIGLPVGQILKARRKADPVSAGPRHFAESPQGGAHGWALHAAVTLLFPRCAIAPAAARCIARDAMTCGYSVRRAARVRPHGAARSEGTTVVLLPAAGARP
jgi:hypothetical protein